MRKSNTFAGTLGDLSDDIQTSIFKYLRINKSLEDEYIRLKGGQVRVWKDVEDNGVPCIMVGSKQANYEYEGEKPMRIIPVEDQLTILEQIEDILRID